MKKAGLFIIILGLGLIVFATFGSFVADKTVITLNNPHHLLWYPLVGIAVLGIGALVLQRSS